MYSHILRWRVDGARAPHHPFSSTNPGCSAGAEPAGLVRSFSEGGNRGEPVYILSTSCLWHGYHHGARKQGTTGPSPVTYRTSRLYVQHNVLQSVEIARIVPITLDFPNFCFLMGIESTIKSFTDILQHEYEVLIHSYILKYLLNMWKLLMGLQEESGNSKSW